MSKHSRACSATRAGTREISCPPTHISSVWGQQARKPWPARTHGGPNQRCPHQLATDGCHIPGGAACCAGCAFRTRTPVPPPSSPFPVPSLFCSPKKRMDLPPWRRDSPLPFSVFGRSDMDRAIAAIVDALRRGRQADTGCGGQSSLSCSQPAFSQQQRAAPGAPWLPEVQEVLGRLSAEELPQLVHQASEADVLDLLKALQHACAPGTCAGRSLCLALAQVCALRPQESTGLQLASPAEACVLLCADLRPRSLGDGRAPRPRGLQLRVQPSGRSRRKRQCERSAGHSRCRQQSARKHGKSSRASAQAHAAGLALLSPWLCVRERSEALVL